ncbi:hypothetical protein CC2G_014559 [Coprinopsis cinerea AmutBmut pab1-1]|nr:hypothetical protein CC2G_014559 [Coprinopsis cinerea AmutBmut pab1-1]
MVQVSANLDLVKLIMSNYNDDLKKTFLLRFRQARLRSFLHISKNFFEAVADEMWGQLEGIFPLLRLLPQFKNSGGIYMVDRVLSLDDFSRWNFYARRVRKITLAISLGGNLGMGGHYLSQPYMMLASFQARHPDAQLFPGLTEIHCNGKQGSDQMACFALLLTPSIRTLRFTEDGCSNHFRLPLDQVSSFLEQAAIISPHLRKIVVYAPSNCKLTLFRFPWSAIARFRRVETVHLQLAYHTFHLPYIHQFSSRKDVTISLFRQHNKSRSERFSLSSHNDETGRHLTLLGNDARITIEKILAGNILSGVTELTLLTRSSHAGPVHGPVWGVVLGHVADTGGHLKRICIKSPSLRWDFDIPIERLEELVTLENLTELELDAPIFAHIPPGTTYDDVFHRLLILTQSKNTPLTQLVLPMFPGLSLKALEHVARDAPSLTVFGTALNSEHPFNDFPSVPSTPNPDGNRHQLLELRLTDHRESEFRVEHFRKVALLLDGLFPETKVVTVSLVDRKSPGAGVVANIRRGWDQIIQMKEDYRHIRCSTLNRR